MKLSYYDAKQLKEKGENGIANTVLRDVAIDAIKEVMGDEMNWKPTAWVNKTEKYISVKLEIDHLTDKEIVKVGKLISKYLPNRFLKITNSTALTGGRGAIFPEPKVLVRFTQKSAPICPHCGN